ncbi:hypothetical protein AB1K91_05675 [Terribacillus sp. 179-K 1B1 HS]|uniref:hypothetical protein n=1 Tax=Terribacillus sp. 179-K 1B1 HS TaxID=3142388 RepID=UPI0039A0D0ED
MSEEKKVIHVKNLIIKADKVILDTDDIEKDKHDHGRKKDRDFDFDPIFGPRRKRNDDHDDKHHDDKHDDKHDDDKHDDKHDGDKGQGRRNFWF